MKFFLVITQLVAEDGVKEEFSALAAARLFYKQLALTPNGEQAESETQRHEGDIWIF